MLLDIQAKIPTSLEVHSRSLPPEQMPGYDPRWFAVYTASRHEKKLAVHLSTRHIEHFLPLYRSLRKWKDGSKVNVELPLFPNYIFVRIARRDRLRVLQVPGVLSIAGAGREPSPLPDDEIEALRRGIGLSRIEPHPYLVIGQKVRINAGPLIGMEGILVRKKSSLRVVITLSLIMQSVAVELDAEDLDPIDTLPRTILFSPSEA